MDSACPEIHTHRQTDISEDYCNLKRLGLMTLHAEEDARDTVSNIAEGISRYSEMWPPQYSATLGSLMGDWKSESSLLYSPLVLTVHSCMYSVLCAAVCTL